MNNISDAAQLRRAGWLAGFAALYTYALIVFGGIVRISGSGMGCGDDWPKCNGEWIPTFTLETLIEYTHRLLAASIGIVLLSVFAYAVLHRARPGVAGRGGVLRPLALGAVLLVAQALLGAITVRLELRAVSVTIAHFITAQIFIATLLVAAVRGGVFGARQQPARAMAASSDGARRGANLALASALFGLVVIAFGAITANVPGAPQACQGFPLCNGAALPASVPAVQIHWAHRLLAFLFFVHLIGAVIRARKSASRAVFGAAATSLALVALQLIVAAAMILSFLPQSLQALHLAVGAAIWIALVIWTALARQELTTPAEPIAPRVRAVATAG